MTAYPPGTQSAGSRLGPLKPDQPGLWVARRAAYFHLRFERLVARESRLLDAGPQRKGIESEEARATLAVGAPVDDGRHSLRIGMDGAEDVGPQLDTVPHGKDMVVFKAHRRWQRPLTGGLNVAS